MHQFLATLPPRYLTSYKVNLNLPVVICLYFKMQSSTWLGKSNTGHHWHQASIYMSCAGFISARCLHAEYLKGITLWTMDHFLCVWVSMPLNLCQFSVYYSKYNPSTSVINLHVIIGLRLRMQQVIASNQAFRLPTNSVHKQTNWWWCHLMCLRMSFTLHSLSTMHVGVETQTSALSACVRRRFPVEALNCICS